MPELLEIDEFEAKAEQADLDALTGGIGTFRFDGNHVNCGHFWKSGETYSDFAWEAWVKPINPSTGGYIISAGYGGNHELLWGITTNTEKATMISKYYGGSSDYTGEGEGFALNDWAHVATTWDGSTLRQYINGLRSAEWAEATARTTSLDDGVNGVLFIGGSDHSNISAHIAQVRGFEGTDAVERFTRWNLPTDIFAERYFRPKIWRISDTSFYDCEFCMNLMVPTTSFIDTSAGFDDGSSAGGRQLHHGAFGGGDNSGYSKERVPFQSTNYPNWVYGDIIAPTYSPTPPSTPVGAVGFDSFSRPDKTMVFYTGNKAGSTEAGSAGVKTWSDQSWCIRDGRMAYPYNATEYNWCDWGITNVDVSVKRPATAYTNTGLILRYVDANNYIFIKANPTQIEARTRIAGSETSLEIDSGFASTWTDLRAVANGTSMDVYKDGVQIMSGLTVPNNSGTKHGLYAPNTGGGINRFDDFLVKAA